MRGVLLFLFVGSGILGGCSIEGTVAPSDDFIVVRAFVFAYEPVTDIRLTSSNSSSCSHGPNPSRGRGLSRRCEKSGMRSSG